MNAQPGTYALIMGCRSAEREVEIGSLGTMVLRPGHYVYVGSAFGTGGIRARVGRHLRSTTRRHWHLDYLRPSVTIGEIWCSYDPLRREHLWAETFSRARLARVPLVGFGASDCNCSSHLFYHPRPPSLSGFVTRVRARDPGHDRVHRIVCQPVSKHILG